MNYKFSVNKLKFNMVEKSQKPLIFDGIKPEAVVFGDSLGEGKHRMRDIYELENKQLTFLDVCRCIWQCKSRVDEDNSRQKVRHKDNEKGGDYCKQACRSYRERKGDSISH